MNTIINFGDYLESHVLDRAEQNARQADMFVCLGTTLMVSPANSLVKMGRKPNRLVICNRWVSFCKGILFNSSRQREPGTATQSLSFF